MNYIKQYGIRGFCFLVKNKLKNYLLKEGEYDLGYPLLKGEPEINVIIYGKGHKVLSLTALKKQKYKNFNLEGKGEYTAFLPAGDVLKEEALYLMVEKLIREGADAVYCDEEKFFKPDFSPDTLNSCDYIGFFIIKSELAGNYKHPYDLLKGNIKVAHCARPLVKSERELEFYGEEIKGASGGVSIIIPSKDNIDTLKNCIDSIRNKLTYKNYEIIVTDNGSNKENAEKAKALADKYIYEECEFNFSYMCNIGARAAEKRFLLFLNDDTQVISPDLLERMTYYAAKPESGAVGAKLYYPEGEIIQHCGVINIQPGPAHAFLGERDSACLYNGRNRGVWNYTAVTGACLMVEKTKFPGFDEDFKVSYNDVALCFSLLEKGYYNMVVNEAKLYHFESLSRGDDRLSKEKLKRLALERERLFDKHPYFSGRDDFYNINLSPYRVDFSKRNFSLYKRDFKEIKEPKSGDFTYKLEYVLSSDWVMISGYGFKGLNSRVYVLLKNNEGRIYRFKPLREMRVDAQAIHGRKALLGGFCLMLGATCLPEGRYTVGLMVGGKAIFTSKQAEFLAGRG